MYEALLCMRKPDPKMMAIECLQSSFIVPFQVHDIGHISILSQAFTRMLHPTFLYQCHLCKLPLHIPAMLNTNMSSEVLFPFPTSFCLSASFLPSPFPTPITIVASLFMLLELTQDFLYFLRQDVSSCLLDLHKTFQCLPYSTQQSEYNYLCVCLSQ